MRAAAPEKSLQQAALRFQQSEFKHQLLIVLEYSAGELFCLEFDQRGAQLQLWISTLTAHNFRMQASSREHHQRGEIKSVPAPEPAFPVLSSATLRASAARA